MSLCHCWELAGGTEEDSLHIRLLILSTSWILPRLNWSHQLTCQQNLDFLLSERIEWCLSYCQHQLPCGMWTSSLWLKKKSLPSLINASKSYSAFRHADEYAFWKFLTKDQNQGCSSEEIKISHKEMLILLIDEHLAVCFQKHFFQTNSPPPRYVMLHYSCGNS